MILLSRTSLRLYKKQIRPTPLLLSNTSYSIDIEMRDVDDVFLHVSFFFEVSFEDVQRIRERRGRMIDGYIYLLVTYIFHYHDHSVIAGFDFQHRYIHI